MWFRLVILSSFNTNVHVVILDTTWTKAKIWTWLAWLHCNPEWAEMSWIHCWPHTPPLRKCTQGDYNVIVVGWDGGSQNIWYPQSASDTRSVGGKIGLVANNLINNGGASPERLYCAGHSLGSHICGHAGAVAHFGRITGEEMGNSWSTWGCGQEEGDRTYVWWWSNTYKAKRKSREGGDIKILGRRRHL